MWQNDTYFLVIKLKLMHILTLLKTFKMWINYSQDCIPYHDTVKKLFWPSKKLLCAVTLFRYNYTTFILALVSRVPSIFIKIRTDYFVLARHNIDYKKTYDGIQCKRKSYKYLKHLIPDWQTLPNIYISEAEKLLKRSRKKSRAKVQSHESVS